MLFGVITIIMAITVTTGSSWISDLMPAEGSGDADAEAFASDAASLGKLSEAFIYIFGIWMLIMGLGGAWICGSKYKGNCICVLLFEIFQAALVVATFVLAVLPFGFYMVSQENIDWFCESSDTEVAANFGEEDSAWYVDLVLEGKAYVTDIDGALAARSDIMCTETCPCDVTDWSLWTAANADFDTSDLVIDNDTGIEDWAGCSALITSEEDADNAVNAGVKEYFNSLLQILENDFDCQGICNGGAFWLYGDVQDGPADSAPCLPTLKSNFSSKSLGASIVLFITVLIDLLLFICMLGNICGKK